MEQGYHRASQKGKTKVALASLFPDPQEKESDSSWDSPEYHKLLLST
jgi:hypothetical protein